MAFLHNLKIKIIQEVNNFNNFFSKLIFTMCNSGLVLSLFAVSGFYCSWETFDVAIELPSKLFVLVNGKVRTPKSNVALIK